LTLWRWDPVGVAWTAVDSSLVGTAINVASGHVARGGLFCVFAAGASSDTIPPGTVADFGAVGGPEQGSIELDWTAPGGDGEIGTALEYAVGYSGSLITEQTWELIPKLTNLPAPAPAGSHEVKTVVLPASGHFYHLVLRAKDEAGNQSPLSNATYAISGVSDPNFRPGAPGNLRAVDAPADSGGVVALNWERSYDDGGGKGTVVEYRVYRNDPPAASPAVIDTVAAGTLAYLDSTATIGQVHTYWVSAADSLQETMADANAAFSAQNLGVPVGDFSSDAVVGVNDFSLFVDTYAIDSTDVEFDPLFDLDRNGDIYTRDFEVFRSHFGEGGIPSSSPPGQNAPAQVFFGYQHESGDQSFLNIRIEGASNLAGYSFKVTYPAGSLSLAGAAADSAGVTGNLLNQDGGLTPLFLTSQPSTGVLWVANAIKGASAYSSPEGEGVLARISFTGSGIEGITVTDVVLMDCDRLMNYVPAAVPTGVTDADAMLRPVLFQSRPNPFNKTTTISFSIPQNARVSLKVFDVQGRLVRTLVDGAQPAGVHPVVWDRRSNDGRSVASGVYFYRLKTPGYEKSRRMVLLK
jgi:hypothetical protein